MILQPETYRLDELREGTNGLSDVVVVGGVHSLWLAAPIEENTEEVAAKTGEMVVPL